jgi:hypothetical protein
LASGPGSSVIIEGDEISFFAIFSPECFYDAKKEKPNFNIGSFSHRVNQNPYHDVIPQLRVRKVDPWPPMIWQGCFQSFIKRMIKMVWAIIDIPNKGGLSGGFIPCRLR